MRLSLFLLALLPAVPCHAQSSLKSAREILAKQNAAPASPYEREMPALAMSAASTAWALDLNKFKIAKAKKSSTENALAWLALAKRWKQLPPTTAPAFGDLVAAIPGPAQWPEFVKAARQNYYREPGKASASYWYLFARLQGDTQGQFDSLRALYRLVAPSLDPKLSKEPRNAQEYRAFLAASREMGGNVGFLPLLAASPYKAQRLAAYQISLKLADSPLSSDSFVMPDLLSQVGEKSAQPLVRQALLSKRRVNWEYAGRTLNFARQLWLKDAQVQKNAPLSVITSSSDLAFNLQALHILQTNKSQQNRGAIWTLKRNILSTLTAQGEYGKASGYVDQWVNGTGGVPYPEIDKELPLARQTQHLRWVESVLKKHPKIGWQNQHAALVARLNPALPGPKLAALKAEVAKPAFNQRHPSIRYAKWREICNLSREIGDTSTAKTALTNAAHISLIGRGALREDVLSLLRFTKVFPDAGLMQLAKEGAKKLAVPANLRHLEPNDLVTLALRFAEQKEVAFAQSIIVTGFNASQKKTDDYPYSGSGLPSQSYLYGLMATFKLGNRPADMVYLLENAKGWGQADLTPLLTLESLDQWGYDVDNPETKTLPKLGYLAAWALAKSKRQPEAIQITKAVIDRAPGYDDAYRLLCDLLGEQARPWLKQVQQADRFEERPLIWQAYLSRRAGKWAEAQQLARQAIAIDPSDGEEGPGDRLRAYSELAAALRSGGKSSEAAVIERAVTSIRLAERADYLRIAGFTNPAIDLYKKALRYFDDAYCIQSRLAVQLVAEGRYSEAGQHFRRAYELMPVSFGRLESHCFGCEGVFGGDQQNSIAKNVFLQLEKERPNDPKVAYLSGYWRSTAGQAATAVQYYRRAVKLDPLYLSAWKKLGDAPQFLTAQEKDAAAIALLKLDPRGIHGSSYSSSSTPTVARNFRGLWETATVVLPRRNLASTAHFKLKSSKTSASDPYLDIDFETPVLRTPGEAIAAQEFVKQIGMLVSPQSAMRM